jgi:hypothetical protein
MPRKQRLLTRGLKRSLLKSFSVQTHDWGCEMALTQDRYDKAIEQAAALGMATGKAAAGWPDVDETNAADILRGIHDVDSEILDQFHLPNLSGEFADDPTVKSVCAELHVSDADDWERDDIATNWENGVTAGFYDELERRAFYQVHDYAIDDPRRKSLELLFESIPGLFPGAHMTFGDLADRVIETLNKLP